MQVATTRTFYQRHGKMANSSCTAHMCTSKQNKPKIKSGCNLLMCFVSGDKPGLDCTSLQNYTQAKLRAMCQAKCLWPASDKAHVCKHTSTARQSPSSSFAHLQILPAFCVRGSVVFRFRQHKCMKAQEHIEAKLKRMLICSPANPRCALCQGTYLRQSWTALRSPSRWQP